MPPETQPPAVAGVGLKNIKAFFLDIDGTLVDSNDFHAKAWQQACDENGYPIEHDAIRQ